jgi:putative transposase
VTGLDFLQPGTPTSNAFAECFNGSFRGVGLTPHRSGDLADAKGIINAWRQHDNEERLKVSRAYLPPARYARQVA